MLLTSVLCALALSGGANAANAVSPGVWRHIPNPPAAGFHEVSATFKVDTSSERTTGYYAASQWSFQGHDVHYFGIQPREPGSEKTGHIAYSVFGKGSTVADSKLCYSSADGGSGVSCAIEIDLDYGREYKIVSKVVETKNGSLRWQGTIYDDAGHDLATLGSFWTDTTYGGLSGKVTQWLEWYPFNGDGGLEPEQRACVPHIKVHYGLPTGYACGNEYTGVKDSEKQPAIGDKCAVKAGTPNQRISYDPNGATVIEGGFLPKV